MLVVAHRSQPDLVVAARRNLPLVIGLGEGENFVGSDVTAFIAHTREARAVEQDQVVEVRREGVTVTDLAGTVVPGESYHVDWDTEAAEKGGYEFFMLKEIDEQPAAVRETLGGRLTARGPAAPRRAGHERRGRPRDRAGLHRGLRVGVPLRADREVRHRALVPAARPGRDGRRSSATATRCSAATPWSSRSSQSGETADTLEAVRHARAQKAWVLAVTNTVGSTISRESDAALYTRGGPEVAVASTKAVMTQITAMYLVGLYLAQLRGTRDSDEVRAHLADLQAVPDLVEELLTRMPAVRELAADLKDERAGAVPRPARRLPDGPGGRAQAQGAGLRQRRGLPGRRDQARADRAGRGGDAGRGARAAARPAGQADQQHPGGAGPAGRARSCIATDGDESVTPYADDVIRIPDTKSLLTPLLMLVPMQVLSAEIARARGLDVDQPRNLAKSVTVE